MKKIITVFCIFFVSFSAIYAQNDQKNVQANSSAINILGKYLVVEGSGTTHVEIKMDSHGRFFCQNYGNQPEFDKYGNLILDRHSQKEEFRQIPIHEAIIIFDLQYDPEKKIWTGGKIHNPYNRLMKADCDAYFVGDGKTLCIFGNIIGVGAKRYWKKIE